MGTGILGFANDLNWVYGRMTGFIRFDLEYFLLRVDCDFCEVN